MKLGRCSDCHAEIRWTRTERGRHMAIDPNAKKGGNVVIRHVDPNGTEHSRVLKRDESYVGLTYFAHAATCTARQQQRRGARR